VPPSESLLNALVERMQGQSWDRIVLPSLFAVQRVRKRWLQVYGQGILPKMVAYGHSMGYTPSCVLAQYPVSLGQGIAWTLDFFHTHCAQHMGSMPADLAGFARSLLHFWEHIDQYALYQGREFPDQELWGQKGLDLPENLVHGVYASGTPFVVQRWLKWWPQWLHQHSLCSQIRAAFLAQQHMLAWWKEHPLEKILLCVQTADPMPQQWLKDLMALPNVTSLVSHELAFLAEGVADSSQQGGHQNVVQNIVCENPSEQARVMAILVKQALENPAACVGIIAPCGQDLKQISHVLKRYDVALSVPRTSLVTTLLQNIWSGSMQGWRHGDVLSLLRHPLIIRQYPLAEPMGHWIERYAPAWPPVPRNNPDNPQDTCIRPRWLGRLHQILSESVQELRDAIDFSVQHGGGKSVNFWMQVHLRALQRLVGPQHWDDDGVVERMSRESCHLFPNFNPVQYGYWMKFWTASVQQLHRSDQDRVVVGNAQDLDFIRPNRCVLGLAQTPSEFPWMPHSWGGYFHIQQESIDISLPTVHPAAPLTVHPMGDIWIVSCNGHPSDSIYRHWAGDLLDKRIVPSGYQADFIKNSAGLQRPYPGLKTISISDLQRWHTDPEAFYRERVLRIRSGVVSFQQLWGMAMHTLLDHFVRDFPPHKHDAIGHLYDGLQALSRVFLPPMPWWQQASKDKLLYEIAVCEHAHRQVGVVRSVTETSGKYDFEMAGAGVSLVGRADRIDYLEDGTAHVIDYKTGAVPTFIALDRMESIQLPTEAWMVSSGFMGQKTPVSTLSWWALHLTKGCQIKTYPRPVPALLECYAARIPQWLAQLACGAYKDPPYTL